MIKGCRKNMIFVKCDRDSSFESAYFIMKSDAVVEGCPEGDLLAEAEKIINNSLMNYEKDGKKKRQRRIKSEKKGHRALIPFAAGATVGSAAGLIWLFF